MLTQEQYNRKIEKALNTHFKPVKEVDQIFTGFLAIELTKDIKIIRTGKLYTLHKGLFFVNNEEENTKNKQLKVIRDKGQKHITSKEVSLSKVYYLKIPKEEVIKLVKAGNIKSLCVVLQPLEIEPPLSLDELYFWCAYDNEKKPKGKEALMKYAFNIEDEVESPLEEEVFCFEEELLKQEGIRPIRHYHSNSKVSQSITNKEYSDKEETLLLKKTKKTEVTTKFSLSYDTENIEGLEKINNFDKLVSNAITSLYVCGNRVISPDQIYYAYQGNNENRPTKKILEKIRQSVDKQRKANITIKCESEVENFHSDEDIKSIEYSGYLLPIEYIKAETNNGKIKEGYHLLAPPTIYRYESQVNKQIITYSNSLLSNKNCKIKSNIENSLLREYLLNRIYNLENSKSKSKENKGISPRIQYETIFNHADIQTLTKQNRYKVIERIHLILDDLVSNDKCILQSYKEYSLGSRRTGIEVFI